MPDTPTPLQSALSVIAEKRPDALTFQVLSPGQFRTRAAQGEWTHAGSYIPFHITKGGSPVNSRNNSYFALLEHLLSLALAERLDYIMGNERGTAGPAWAVLQKPEGEDVWEASAPDLACALACALATYLESNPPRV